MTSTRAARRRAPLGRTAMATAVALLGSLVVTAAPAVGAIRQQAMTTTATTLPAKVTLLSGPTQISADPYAGTDSAQHDTEVEPDVVANGTTVVSAFQVGRFDAGGAGTNIGWASSLDGGANWTSGMLSGISAAGGGADPRTVNESVAYDDKHATWLISALGVVHGSTSTSYVEQDLYVSTSTDAVHWDATPYTVTNLGHPDKDWVGCDNTPTSQHYGRCYAVWSRQTTDDGTLTANLELNEAYSDDAGHTWSAPIATVGAARGYDAQPVVLPNGTLVITATAVNSAGQPIHQIESFVSADGGVTITGPTTIASFQVHTPSDIRAYAKPTTSIAGDGRVFVAWPSCSLAPSCGYNDVFLSSTTDGTTWSTPSRVTNAALWGSDDVIPALGADPGTSGATTRLALLYWRVPAGCDNTNTACTMQAQFIGSRDAGATWSDPIDLGPTSPLTDLPSSTPALSTTRMAMVGDYFHIGFSGGHCVTTFPIAGTYDGSYHQAMNAAVISIDVPTVPGAPTGVTAATGPNRADVSWTAPASDGGAHVSGYVVTASPGGATRTVSGSATSMAFTGLPTGTYSFTVQAVNAAGTGPTSAPSSAVYVSVPPSAPRNVSIGVVGTTGTVAWTIPASDGGSAITTYTAKVFVHGTSTPVGSITRSAGARTATFQGLSSSKTYDVTVTAANYNGSSAVASASWAPGDRFVPVTPARIVNGVTIRAGHPVVVNVLGVGPLPRSGVDAVAVNVTVLRPSRSAAVGVSPYGQSPAGAVLRFVGGQAISNLTTVRPNHGHIQVVLSSGTASLYVDVEGYYARVSGGDTYVPLRPAHIYTSRALVAGHDQLVRVTSVGGLPASGVDAVLANVTLWRETRAGYLRVVPAGQRSSTGTQMFSAGQMISNAVTMKAVNGRIQLHLSAGSAAVSVDVLGYFTRSSSGRLYHPLAPVRIAGPTTLRSSADTLMPVLGLGGVPVTGVTAIAANVEVVGATAAAYLRVLPSNIASTLATQWFGRGRSIGAFVTVMPGSGDHRVREHVSAGAVTTSTYVEGYYSTN